MTPGGRRVTCVAAVGPDGVIGDGPRIPWRVPGEQAVFKRVTLGHVLLMGRTTYESIGRPLPGRTTVVLTRDAAWRPAPAPGSDAVLVATSLDDAVRLVDGVPGAAGGASPPELMVAGGAQVYAAVLAVPCLVDRQVLSEIDPAAVDFTAATDLADPVRYPPLDPAAWTEVEREPHPGFDVVTHVRSVPRSA